MSTPPGPDWQPDDPAQQAAPMLASDPLVVIGERGGIGRCFTLVNRRFWPTAGRILLYGLIVVLYFVLVNAVVGLLVGTDSAAATVLRQVLTLPLGLAGVGVAVVTYAELRFHERPDVRTPTL